LGDPFLAYIYIASISIFIALYQVFKVLGYVRQKRIFSQAAVHAVRTIRHCALFFVACIAAADAYLFMFVRGTDDIAGGVAMGLFLIIASVVIAAAAAVFEGILRDADASKSDKSLTA
jgi:hypothetical protein